MLNINTQLQIRETTFNNRIVVPAMASQTANTKGFVTQATLNHYQRLSKSKASLLFVEYSYISLQGRSEPQQLGIDSSEKLNGLKQLAYTIKQNNIKAGIQLVHAGGKTTKQLTNGELIGPSAIAIPVKGEDLEIPSEATNQEIQDIKNDFIKASLVAVQAGFDAIEIHAAHGYGINQWLSPLTNQRNDLFGGSLYNRARILFEIISEIRNQYPKIILSVRIPGQDHIEGGLTNCDSILLSKKLVELGVDIINVSSGIGGWRRPRDRKGEGYLVDDACKIQKHISAPVIGVGGIKTKNYIEEKLNSGAFSFAAIGRAILDNPLLGQQLISTKEIK